MVKLLTDRWLAKQPIEPLLSRLAFVFIVASACLPLLVTFPYHINIFLSWEGAYRLYLGQIPYKDFGMPLGFGYWLLPALFFKLFGPALFTLVIAQAFINIISGLAFQSILRSLAVGPGLRFLGVVLYVASFSFTNFLPWYNHTDIVFEFIGLAFLLKFIFRAPNKNGLVFLAPSVLFIVLSIFTKQDGGGMGLLIACALMLAHQWFEKKTRDTVYFGAMLLLSLAIFIVPFLPYHFNYWFNHGQAPHNARLSLPEIFETLLSGSEWIKFYLVVLAIIISIAVVKRKQTVFKKQTFMFLLLTLGVLVEASIYQVTSYTPPDTNIFFHSFAFICIFHLAEIDGEMNRFPVLMVCVFFVLFWWSNNYFRSFNRYINRFLPTVNASLVRPVTANTDGIHENIINRHTYILDIGAPQAVEDTAQWRLSPYRAFKRVLLPPKTITGIADVAKLGAIHQTPRVTILNMTELTPLESEFNLTLEKGSDIPLWYHLGVGMFQKQTEAYCNKIKHNFYPLVLFEFIPNLNNFYPFRVRDTLNKYYVKLFEFPAPRRPNLGSIIEVFEPNNGPDVMKPKP